MELIWTDCAKESLREITRYVEFHFTPLLAKKIFDSIHGEVGVLRHSPYLGRIVFSHTSYGELRRLTIRRNNVYYRIIDNRVEVVVVWDYRRSQDELLDRILDYFNALE